MGRTARQLGGPGLPRPAAPLRCCTAQPCTRPQSPARPLVAVGEKARTLGLVLAAGGGYALWQHLPLEQALNGFISVLVFNIIYDLLLRCGPQLQ